MELKKATSWVFWQVVNTGAVKNSSIILIMKEASIEFLLMITLSIVSMNSLVTFV